MFSSASSFLCYLCMFYIKAFVAVALIIDAFSAMMRLNTQLVSGVQQQPTPATTHDQERGRHTVYVFMPATPSCPCPSLHAYRASTNYAQQQLCEPTPVNRLRQAPAPRFQGFHAAYTNDIFEAQADEDLASMAALAPASIARPLFQADESTSDSDCASPGSVTPSRCSRSSSLAGSPMPSVGPHGASSPSSSPSSSSPSTSRWSRLPRLLTHSSSSSAAAAAAGSQRLADASVATAAASRMAPPPPSAAPLRHSVTSRSSAAGKDASRSGISSSAGRNSSAAGCVNGQQSGGAAAPRHPAAAVSSRRLNYVGLRAVDSLAPSTASSFMRPTASFKAKSASRVAAGGAVH
ncbi:hypothetical protein GPECTOR_83g291 [Gonium pectorale]|uniref:Uncharacterized protein n=1 Tax=Gonium pectorale TaxID=33097 RepID=A0A150G1D1_GONPE|nr:hypothetical protein GPECTOR_83g291 [Gonium pectorale]|eukprot:KXZ43679.1 hypothetical protein GPECTOR_83g291 [Gonium pectorale]